MTAKIRNDSVRFGSHLIHLIAGIAIGFALTSQLRTLRYQWKINSACPFNSNDGNNGDNNHIDIQRQSMFNEIVDSLDSQPSSSNLVLIGVMTAQKYIDTRALAIHQTWGKHVPGKIIFFSSSSTRSSYGLPLVPLPTVDDSYPPQKKSFLMLKFMHDHYLDKFEYFMRADDDVFLNIGKLETFLRSINSSETQFIGQAGLGNKEEFGQLSLEADENFCMGGPGVIMSKSTLAKFAPNIQYCLKHLYSTHEDVEVGRCVRKFVNVACTWSYEMQHLFHHNVSAESDFVKGKFRAKELNRAISMHPVKIHSSMRKLNAYYQMLAHKTIRFKLSLIERNILEMQHLLNVSKTDAKLMNLIRENHFSNYRGEDLNFLNFPSRDSIIPWDFLAHNFFSSTNINPKRHIENHIKHANENNINDLMMSINKNSNQRGRIMDFKSLYYGYMRVDPFKGVEYILDLLLVYKKYRGRKIAVPVRRHAYSIQTFSQSRIREIHPSKDVSSEIVNIIVPLSGRIEAFHRFIDNYKQVQLIDKYISLSVVLFPDASQSKHELIMTHTILERLQHDGLQIRVAQLSGLFSRAAALQRGATMFASESLLLFLDVDMHFDDEVINRVRLNTIRGNQVYFPIVFSEYSPQFIDESENGSSKLHLINDMHGYWRQFGFGIVALYNSDLQSVGGFNISIKGWGIEDVNLYDKIVHSNLSIVRCVDPSLSHIYHDIFCDSSLTSIQYEMCLGTKLTSLASVKSLSNYLNKNKYLRL